MLVTVLLYPFLFMAKLVIVTDSQLTVVCLRK